MNLTKLFECILAVACITCVGLSNAKAEIVFNDGEEVTLQYFFDGNLQGTPPSAIVSSGVEFTGIAGLPIDFDFSRNLLQIDLSGFGGFQSGFTHVFRIIDTSDSIADFTNVFISDQTSQAYKDILPLGSFTVDNVNQVTLDLSPLDTSFNFAGNGPLLIEFNGGLAAVPEPGTFAVLGLAAAGLWTRGKLKKRQAS